MIRRTLPVVALVLAGGCRGSISEQPPVHIIPDMDWQPKYLQQGESAFFADHRASRIPPEGTVARGELKADTAFYQGKIDGSFVNKVPFTVDESVMRRGEQRFNIYCAPCHDQTGTSNGTVVQHGVPYGLPRPLVLYADHARELSDGEIFDRISNGSPNHNMPAYGPQIPEKDRWAIVAWVRVLQRAEHATVADVPSEQLKDMQEEAPQ
jgi:mono/diheme cytochrome c family protein